LFGFRPPSWRDTPEPCEARRPHLNFRPTRRLRNPASTDFRGPIPAFGSRLRVWLTENAIARDGLLRIVSARCCRVSRNRPRIASYPRGTTPINRARTKSSGDGPCCRGPCNSAGNSHKTTKQPLVEQLGSTCCLIASSATTPVKFFGRGICHIDATCCVMLDYPSSLIFSSVFDSRLTNGCSTLA
jgi:hypothetical protein